MQHDKRTHAGLLLISTTLGAAGQLLFKIGVGSAFGKLVVFLGAGVAAYLLSTVIYLYVLGRRHLSWAYGFSGLSYIFASLAAFLFLGESVPFLRWVGIVVIAIGTALIGVS